MGAGLCSLSPKSQKHRPPCAWSAPVTDAAIGLGPDPRRLVLWSYESCAGVVGGRPIVRTTHWPHGNG